LPRNATGAYRTKATLLYRFKNANNQSMIVMKITESKRAFRLHGYGGP
jgi:hypothetical protein